MYLCLIVYCSSTKLLSSAFQTPGSPAGMQALLEHSVQCYRPLASDLRTRRVRTSSQPSPYPQSRVSKITISPDQTRPSNKVEEVPKAFATPVLQEIKVNTNNVKPSSVVPSLEAIKPFSPIFLDVEPKRENAYGLAPVARPRVPLNARRTALGWSGKDLSFLMTIQPFIHPLRRLVVYPTGDMNRHSVSCPFLHTDMLLTLVHFKLILLIMDYAVYEKAPKTCRAFLYFMENRPQRRVESDASSFYFKAPSFSTTWTIFHSWTPSSRFQHRPMIMQRGQCKSCNGISFPSGGSL